MIKVDFASRYGSRILPSFRLTREIFPLFEYRQGLFQRGIDIRFVTLNQLPLSDSGSVLCLDSRCFAYPNGSLCPEDMQLLERLSREYDRVLWFDNRDSTGTTQFEVLPFVHKYCKKQLLKDRSLYQRVFYGERIFTDYMYRQYNVCDDKPETSMVRLNSSQSEKLVLSWNIAYSDYLSGTRIERFFNAFFRGSRQPLFFENSNRTYLLQARYSTDYCSNVVAFQRRSLLKVLDKLSDGSIRVGKLHQRKYRTELIQTEAVLSPFGWGEICARDFEAMIYGCALIKPNVSHLETWPDIFWPGQTYIPLPWDIERTQTILEEVLSNKSLLRTVAETGQQVFKEFWGEQGEQKFCDHVEALVCSV